MGADAEFTPKEVALHTERNDCWMAIRGEVYDVTKYLADHPGGVDIMLEFAGKDATEAFANAGHSEDADEIMADYRIGALKGGAARKAAAATVRVALKAVPQAKKMATSSSSSGPSPAALGGAVVSLGALAAAVLGLRRTDTSALTDLLQRTTMHLGGGATTSTTATIRTGGFGFGEGFVLASALAVLAGGLAAQKLSSLIVVGHAPREQPHRKMARVVARPGDEDRLARGLARGFLDPRAFQPLPLAAKELVAPGVYRLLFELPTPDAVLGLPTGQHVAIKASVPDGNGGETTVQRSYTPVSNDGDRGVLDLVVRVYPDGLLTGRYLANLAVGDEVLFRGPKGAMRYRRGLCRKVGMLAGGTGITPMYQLLRAICEDPRDATEVSLVYACRAEGDILLRAELEAFARRYPGNLKSVHYLLDDPPAEGWAYGRGYVTKEIMAERFPDPREEGCKVMLCGPPGMVNAAKKGLVELGYEKPSLASKMTDQIFCF